LLYFIQGLGLVRGKGCAHGFVDLFTCFR
jgi:hypothetical protein